MLKAVVGLEDRPQVLELRYRLGVLLTIGPGRLAVSKQGRFNTILLVEEI
jgi:hypothetical protein